MDTNEWLRILDESCRRVEDVLDDLRNEPATAFAAEKLSAVFQEYREVQGKVLDGVGHTDDR